MFKGSIVAIVTPFKDNKLDEQALKVYLSLKADKAPDSQP